MIHTASLVHDDVLDECNTRRGAATVNSLYGTRIAVLAGDFLFAQSSWFLANLDNLEVSAAGARLARFGGLFSWSFLTGAPWLRFLHASSMPRRTATCRPRPAVAGWLSCCLPMAFAPLPRTSLARCKARAADPAPCSPRRQVIKLISQVIADFANGEISQAARLFDTSVTLEEYLDKSFFKTASLIAASARSAAVFSDVDTPMKEAMYGYGKHLGLAFQVRAGRCGRRLAALCRRCHSLHGIRHWLTSVWFRSSFVAVPGASMRVLTNRSVSSLVFAGCGRHPGLHSDQRAAGQAAGAPPPPQQGYPCFRCISVAVVFHALHACACSACVRCSTRHMHHCAPCVVSAAVSCSNVAACPAARPRGAPSTSPTVLFLFLNPLASPLRRATGPGPCERQFDGARHFCAGAFARAAGAHRGRVH